MEFLTQSFLFISGCIVLAILVIYTIETKGKSYALWPSFWVIIGIMLILVWEHPHIEWRWIYLIYILVYIVTGILWSFFKWFKYVKRSYKELQNKRRRYPNDYTLSDSEYKPVLSEEKEQLCSWIVFWPFSLVRYAIGDFIADIFNKLIDKITFLYERITNNQFK